MDDWVRWLAIEIAVATTTLAFFGEAWGSGFQIRENSAAALGNAFAGAATSSEDPSIIANNPAGMAAMRWVLSPFLRLTGSMMPHPI